jgi:hypothetical protein
MMHVPASGSDSTPDIPNVGNQAAGSDVAYHSGGRNVIDDPIVLPVVALIQLPTLCWEFREQYFAFLNLIGGMRPTNHFAKRRFLHGDKQLASVAAPYVE